MIKQQVFNFFISACIFYATPTTTFALDNAAPELSNNTVTQAKTPLPQIQDALIRDIQQQRNHNQIVIHRLDSASSRVKNMLPAIEAFRERVKEWKTAHPQNIHSEKVVTAPLPVTIDPPEHSSNIADDNLDVVDSLLEERRALFTSINNEKGVAFTWLWQLALISVGVVWLVQTWGIEKIAAVFTQKRLLQIPNQSKRALDKAVAHKKPGKNTIEHQDIFSSSSLQYINPSAITVEEVDIATYSKWEQVWQKA